MLYFPFTIFHSLFTSPSPAYAAEPPDPQPCQNAKFDQSKLTDNWLTGPNGEPYITVTKPEDDEPVSFQFEVNFSKLSALFGPSNSNYLEGKFQDQEHKSANISQLDQAGISKFHGPSQKAAPRAMLDPLKVETVRYIFENNTLAESADTYTDFNGNDPKTIYDMQSAYGQPDPETQRGTDAWTSGWGRYWDKIPTTYSEFYEGRIIFKYARGDAEIQSVISGGPCPQELPRQITFIMPEFFRTTAVSGQLNQVVVPNAAQSDVSNDLVLAQNSSQTAKSVLGKIVESCFKFIKNNPLTENLKKVIGNLPKIFNPLTNVYAEESPGCIKILGPGKEGQDPYCALPDPNNQLQGRENCSNQTDQFKQDKENENVICTFYIVIPADLPAGEYGIWPVFRIPLTSEIWNNTLFADEDEPVTGDQGNEALGPIKGRPGVYSFFTPRVVFEDEIEALLRKCDVTAENAISNPACQELLNIALENPDAQPTAAACIQNAFITNPNAVLNCVEYIVASLEKKKPGESNQDALDSIKRRFVGGTDCSKEFVWHNALYPRAAQQQFGITNDCPLTAAAQLPDQGPAPGTGPPGGIPPGGTDTLYYYIKYGDTSIGIDPATRAEITDMVNGPDSSWPDNNIDQWDYVVSQSIARGVSPAFTIAIWMEEGGFGGAGAIDQFGMINCSQHDLVSSLNCFLDFTASRSPTGEYPYNPNDPYGSFYNWVNNFCGPNREYICGPSLTDPSDTNENFIPNLEWAITTVNPDAIEYAANI